MKEIIEKLSSYNIFNYLLPGVLFAGIGGAVTSFPLIHEDVVVGMFFYYFYGLVISRVGSLILEPLLKRVAFIKFSPYEDYLSAAKVDPKIDTLSESNNQYRTLSALFVSLIFLMSYEGISQKITIPDKAKIILSFLTILVIFLYAYRKQTSYISNRIAKIKSSESNE